MSTMKSKISAVVAEVASRYEYPADHRIEIARTASLLLDKKGINCAVDGSKAGDYLVEALDENC